MTRHTLVLLATVLVFLPIGAIGQSSVSHDLSGPAMLSSSAGWAKRAGSSSKDMALDIASDVAGNIYVTGYFYGGMSLEGFILDSSANSKDDTFSNIEHP